MFIISTVSKRLVGSRFMVSLLMNAIYSCKPLAVLGRGAACLLANWVGSRVSHIWAASGVKCIPLRVCRMRVGSWGRSLPFPPPLSSHWSPSLSSSRWTRRVWSVRVEEILINCPCSLLGRRHRCCQWVHWWVYRSLEAILPVIYPILNHLPLVKYL